MPRKPLLSEAAAERMETYKKFQAPIERPEWDQHFLAEAFNIAKRSHDSQTKCGCVITRGNRLLTSGYNGFPRDFPHDELPNIRPEKYDWMVHAEANALCNAAYEGVKLAGSTVYVTADPCKTCMTLCYQAGVVEFVTPKENPVKPDMMDNHDWVEFFEIFKHLGFGRVFFRQATFEGV